MEIIDAPFIKLNPNSIARPCLPVTLSNPHTGLALNTWGLIDTGADECAVPAGYASLLGHNLLAGTVKSIGTGNGITTAYAHTLCINTKGLEVNDVLIDFMPNLHMVLLGAKSFLSRFTLVIDYKKQSFSLLQSR